MDLERTAEAVDGIQFAIQEIDEEIRTHIRELKRRNCTPRVMEEVDTLLDYRNELSEIIGELSIQGVHYGN